MGVIQQILLYEIFVVMLLMRQNTTMRVYGAWIKLSTVYVQKHIVGLVMCYNQPLVHDKLLGAPASVKLVYCSTLRLEQMVLTFDSHDEVRFGQWQTITWTNIDSFHWCMYLPPVLNVLNYLGWIDGNSETIKSAFITWFNHHLV